MPVFARRVVTVVLLLALAGCGNKPDASSPLEAATTHASMLAKFDAPAPLFLGATTVITRATLGSLSS